MLISFQFTLLKTFQEDWNVCMNSLCLSDYRLSVWALTRANIVRLSRKYCSIEINEGVALCNLKLFSFGFVNVSLYVHAALLLEKTPLIKLFEENQCITVIINNVKQQFTWTKNIFPTVLFSFTNDSIREYNLKIIFCDAKFACFKLTVSICIPWNLLAIKTLCK